MILVGRSIRNDEYPNHPQDRFNKDFTVWFAHYEGNLTNEKKVIKARKQFSMDLDKLHLSSPAPENGGKVEIESILRGLPLVRMRYEYNPRESCYRLFLTEMDPASGLKYVAEVSVDYPIDDWETSD